MCPNSVVKYFKSFSSSSTSRTLPRGRQGWVGGRCGLSLPDVIGILLVCLSGIAAAPKDSMHQQCRFKGHTLANLVLTCLFKKAHLICPKLHFPVHREP